MAKKQPIKIMLSSTVYHNEHVIEAIYNQLKGYGYEVICSHMGTVYAAPGKSNEENCLKAVEDCDFFFGVIFNSYGSGITHKEFLHAIAMNKPRGFLVHSYVPYTRILLKDFMFNKGNRTDFELPKRTMVLDSLKVIDMYNDAIGNGNHDGYRLWAHQFYKYELDGAPFVNTLFSNYPRFETDLKAL